MADKQTYIVNDLPTGVDALDFKPYVETLADIAQTGNTPLTIGVFGSWGAGKTSLMMMVRDLLVEDCTIAWFDAWKYDKEETLWRAFLLSILSALHENDKLSDDELSRLTAMLYRALDLEKTGGVTIDLAKLTGKTVLAGVQMGLSFFPGVSALTKLVEELQKSSVGTASEGLTDAIQRERSKIHLEQVRSLEQFEREFRLLVDDRVESKGERLVVFIDDLDRCLPEKAIEVLEAIKLFVDAPGCVFILGLDREVIERGIEIRYREHKQKDRDQLVIDGARYLEKIIQLPFQLPTVERAKMDEFVGGLAQDWGDERCPAIFAEGLGENPRQIKRTVNMFLMLWKLADRRELKEKITPTRLAKVVAIQAMYPHLYNRVLKDVPRYLRSLEEYYRAEAGPEKALRGAGEDVEGQEAREPLKAPAALEPFVGRAPLRRIMTQLLDAPEACFSDLTGEQLSVYFTLARSAEAPGAEAGATLEERLLFEPQTVRIPAGNFLMGSTPEQAQMVIDDAPKDQKDNWKNWTNREQPQHEVELSEYSIGKYPVTNREYQAYVQATKASPPKGWDGENYPPEKGDHPVVYVSWDDAQAYCQWLSEKTKKVYRLPTEAEWEKAARWKASPDGAGGEALVYPWGNEFDKERCNVDESGIGDTTPVDRYENGVSPYGVYDMVGNVWEWCRDWFDEDEYKNRARQVVKDPPGPEKGSLRVLRGGSFDDTRRNSRCAGRGRLGPRYSLRDGGFRVVVSPVFVKSEL